MAKRIKNADVVEHTWVGQTIAVGEYYEIQRTEEPKWLNDSQLMTDIGNGVAVVNDGANDIPDVATALKWLNDKSPIDVITLLERDDKGLRLASAVADFVSNVAVVNIPIPGDPGTIGRYVAGGYGFTDIYGFGDRVVSVDLVDVSFLYAGTLYPPTPTEAGIPGVEGLSWADIMPDGVVLGSYHDTDVDPSLAGWRLWCDDGNQGGVDIDPLGGYGHLLALTTLRIRFEKTGGSGATKAAVNVWWGKEEVL